MSESKVIVSRLDGPVHHWFGLSYGNYLVIPRSLMQAMPVEWQERMVECLDQISKACVVLGKINDNYTVLLRGPGGRTVADPYAPYRHSRITRLDYE